MSGVPLDPSQLSASAVGNIFMQQIPADNVVLKFVLNFVVLAVLTGITSQYQNWIQWAKDIIAKFRNNSERRPELRFTAREALTSYSSGLTASLEFKAWLGRIRDIISSKKSDSKLLKLQEFRERSYYYDDDEDDGKKTRWLPNQSDAFQLTDKIWAQFHSDEISEGEENGRSSKTSHKEYTLCVYVKDVCDRVFLIDYHDKLMKEYHEKSRLTLNTQPHIFELKGVDGESGDLEWNQYPFSSTRRMDHIWFKEKETFVKTYNYFLDNKAEYERRGDPWTFSCLLHGVPGCGKTSLLKAIVNDSVARGEMAHIFIISFSKIQSAEQLARVIFDVKVLGHNIPLSQRILVFEDFDANGASKVFAKRDNLGKDAGSKKAKKVDTTGFGSDDMPSKEELIKKLQEGTELADIMIGPKPKSTGLNLSDVLNILDGINERTGQRCFWTTNANPPEKYFDPAFLRPGRMDMMIEFTRCTPEGIQYLLQHYYNKDIPDEQVARFPDDVWTPAEVKQLCKESFTIDDAVTRVLQRDTPLVKIEAREEEAPEAPSC